MEVQGVIDKEEMGSKDDSVSGSDFSVISVWLDL